MSTAAQILLIGSNVILASAVSFHVLKSDPAPSQAPTSNSSSAGSSANLDPATLGQLENSITRLGTTLQGFNTSLVQYDYLQNEIERLGKLDQAIAERINLAQARKTKDTSANLQTAIDQLSLAQTGIKKEIERRRETVRLLISGLERKLDAATPQQTPATTGLENRETPKAPESKTRENAPSPGTTNSGNHPDAPVNPVPLMVKPAVKKPSPDPEPRLE